MKPTGTKPTRSSRPWRGRTRSTVNPLRGWVMGCHVTRRLHLRLLTVGPCRGHNRKVRCSNYYAPVAANPTNSRLRTPHVRSPEVNDRLTTNPIHRISIFSSRRRTAIHAAALSCGERRRRCRSQQSADYSKVLNRWRRISPGGIALSEGILSQTLGGTTAERVPTFGLPLTRMARREHSSHSLRSSSTTVSTHGGDIR